MLTSEFIKQKAKELGATVCGIGKVYDEPDPQRDPRSILPNAKCIIGFGFAVPRGLYKTMELNSQYYTYTTLGVKYIDEEMAEIFLLKLGGLIENEGYDACLQKAIPNLRIQGDKTTNPEVMDTYELIHAVPVAPGKPAPDGYLRAAKVLGVDPADCVVFEDSISGVRAAHAAGIGKIVAICTEVSAERLLSYPGVVVAEKDFSNMIEIWKELLSK